MAPGFQPFQRFPKFPKITDRRKTRNPRRTCHAIWTELMSLKRLVENEHDRKLRRIETDLHWTMMLVGAQFITIIGTAIATLVGG